MKYSLRTLMGNVAEFFGHYWVEMGTGLFLAVGGILPVLILHPGVLVSLLLVPLGWVGGAIAWLGVLAVVCWIHERKKRQ